MPVGIEPTPPAKVLVCCHCTMETSPDHRAQRAATGSSESGTLGGIRTHNIMLLRHAPLPVGLRGQMVSVLGVAPRLPTRQVGVLLLNYTLEIGWRGRNWTSTRTLSASCADHYTTRQWRDRPDSHRLTPP